MLPCQKEWIKKTLTVYTVLFSGFFDFFKHLLEEEAMYLRITLLLPCEKGAFIRHRQLRMYYGVIEIIGGLIWREGNLRKYFQTGERGNCHLV